MTDQDAVNVESVTIITPAIKNEYLAELRDIMGYLSIINEATETIKEITAESKEKYGISAGEMKGIAKKLMEDKLGEDISKSEVLLDWKQIASEENV